MVDTLTNKSSTQAWMVIAVTALALLIGWGLRIYFENQTRPVALGGVTAQVPAGWLVESGGAGLLGRDLPPGTVFSARDPLDPGTSYLVSLAPVSPDGGLAAAAAVRNLQRAQNRTAYRVLEQTPVTLGMREGYKVVFAYVDAGQVDQVPVIYEGVDYYFKGGEQVIIVTLETSESLDRTISDFRDFAAVVELGGER